MSTAVKAEDGVEVYRREIDILADEYISKTFPDCEDDEIKMLMRKSQPFKGLLKYINSKLFKISDNDIKYNNKNSNIDYNNIDYINDLWSLYTGICYKYLQNPTILNFSLFTGIDTDTFNSWKNAEYKAGADGASSSHSVSVKKWLKECESALYDTAMTGNPGAMFLLKANYGYSEAPQQIQVLTGQQPEQIAADIAARHMIAGSQDIVEPEKPEGI